MSQIGQTPVATAFADLVWDHNRLRCGEAMRGDEAIDGQR
jgi:hypothetical protein